MYPCQDTDDYPCQDTDDYPCFPFLRITTNTYYPIFIYHHCISLPFEVSTFNYPYLSPLFCLLPHLTYFYFLPYPPSSLLCCSIFATFEVSILIYPCLSHFTCYLTLSIFTPPLPLSSPYTFSFLLGCSILCYFWRTYLYSSLFILLYLLSHLI